MLQNSADAEIIPPKASSLAVSLRSFGYDLETALADVVDNSVSAEATEVWLEFAWNEGDPYICITDNGVGMSQSELRIAMMLGGRNPLEQRKATDLGRFGLGLKTASFSQCKSVTVITKCLSEAEALMRWDLDHLAQVDQWEVLRLPKPGAEQAFKQFDSLARGTAVLWQSLDRVTKGKRGSLAQQHNRFLAHCERVALHLGLVFHRLIESENRIGLWINGQLVKARNPFFPFQSGQALPPDWLKCAHGMIEVQAFVLPHEHKLSGEDERLAAEEVQEWISKQGFYVYRGDRLLLGASWLGLKGLRKDVEYKLARVRVLLPNTYDEDWLIDVSKSKAVLPDYLIPDFQRVANRARSQSKKVYSLKLESTVRKSSGRDGHVWEQSLHSGRFKISRSHPLIQQALGDPHIAKTLSAILNLVEASLPETVVLSSTISEPQLSETINMPVTQAWIEGLDAVWQMLKAAGYSADKTFELLSSWEPYNQRLDLLEEKLMRERYV